MTLQQLQYLISIAQYDSINQAAQSLFVSQSGISKSIKQLEDELGFRLLERTHRGVAFTAQGQEFLRDTYALIEQFDSFKLRYSGSSHDIINFSVSSQHYIFVLGAVVKAAERKKDFRYTISLREKKTSEIIEDVVSRRSQIGFVYYYDVTSEFMRRELERYNLVFHPFCEATPHVYLSVHHPLASASALSLSQLEHYPYVCYDLGTDPTHLAEEMFSPRIHPSSSMSPTAAPCSISSPTPTAIPSVPDSYMTLHRPQHHHNAPVRLRQQQHHAYRLDRAEKPARRARDPAIHPVVHGRAEQMLYRKPQPASFPAAQGSPLVGFPHTVSPYKKNERRVDENHPRAFAFFAIIFAIFHFVNPRQKKKSRQARSPVGF